MDCLSIAYTSIQYGKSRGKPGTYGETYPPGDGKPGQARHLRAFLRGHGGHHIEPVSLGGH
ncbi:hypothetical protein KDAU_57470 [Dictyobacter aurantiacus]|uniref:Uncharacterized protein n=1 Tax=Dictyobacter aurantiacus TaxID=1936993 RepID=A0A401ZND8_9CHLR|nr:hypothetical protein KDAU_57470 [Dictyobacter aurantiacus]